MILDFSHLIFGVVLLASTGALHIITVKWEYKWGTKGWWIFLIAGIISIVSSFFISSMLIKGSLVILGVNLLWTVHEVSKQYDRVEKKWFPEGPGHKREKMSRTKR